jgi:hypothetical protein
VFHVLQMCTEPVTTSSYTEILSAQINGAKPIRVVVWMAQVRVESSIWWRVVRGWRCVGDGCRWKSFRLRRSEGGDHVGSSGDEVVEVSGDGGKGLRLRRTLTVSGSITLPVFALMT